MGPRRASPALKRPLFLLDMFVVPWIHLYTQFHSAVTPLSYSSRAGTQCFLWVLGERCIDGN